MRIYKEDYNKFKILVNELKNKYDFQGLWHFTDFSNLNSIFSVGELSSRKMCKDNVTSFLDGANHDVISKATEFVHNCTRFYYRPKTPTLYDNEGIKPIKYSKEIHIPRPVYLLFSDELIYAIDTVFSNGNATNSPRDSTIEFFKEMDWDAIFHNTWFIQEERDYIINKRHAELLSKSPVHLKHLNKIIFRSNADLKQAIRVWGKDNRFIANGSYFSDKSNLQITDWKYNNYISDYHIEQSVDKLKLIIILDKPLNNYVINWSIIDVESNNKVGLLKKTLSTKFKDVLNNSVELKFASKVELTFSYRPSNGDVINIYLNSVLSIIETIKTNEGGY